MILTKLSDKDFEQILSNYDIGKCKSHEHIPWALANTVYKIKAGKGRFILKVFEKASFKFVTFQIDIMNFLDKNKIPVAKICKTIYGKDILNYKHKQILIQNFVDGKTSDIYNNRLLLDIAKNFGRMCKCLTRLKIDDRSKWKKDYQFKIYEKLKMSDFDFERRSKELFRELKKLDRKKLKGSITHGDFHGVNLIFKANQLRAVIDFDDAHEDYLAYEVAVFLIDPFISKKSVNKRQLRLFFKEFQKHFNFNSEEKKAIYYFVKHRLLGMMTWIEKQKKVHKEHKKNLNKFLGRIIAKFNSFDKVSLDEFILLVQ